MRAYNRHYKNGFTTVMINDLYDVETQLQAIDPNLYLMWNPHTGEHLIMDGSIAVMKIPQKGFPELTSKVVYHIQKISNPNYSAIDEIEQSEMKREKEIEKKNEDIAENLAKDTVKLSTKKSFLMGA